MWSPYRLDTECRCMLGVVDLQLTMGAREARDVYLQPRTAERLEPSVPPMSTD